MSQAVNSAAARPKGAKAAQNGENGSVISTARMPDNTIMTMPPTQMMAATTIAAIFLKSSPPRPFSQAGRFVPRKGGRVSQNGAPAKGGAIDGSAGSVRRCGCRWPTPVMPCPVLSCSDSGSIRVTLSQGSLQSNFCNIFQSVNMPQIALTAYPPLPMLRALPPILRLAGVAACCSGDTLRIGDNDRTEPR